VLNIEATSGSLPTEKEWKMPKGLWFTLAAALMIAIAGEALAQGGTPPDPGAAANVRQSQLYEQMLRSNPSFRAKRMQLECGTITDPELRASCEASFQAYGPTPTSAKGRR
jgi:hypothetical protein